MLPVMGLNIATLALVARNFGARRTDRIRETVKYSMSAGLAITLGCTVLVWILAPQLIGLFTRDPAVASVGARYLRVESLVFCAYIILYISVSTLQGTSAPLLPGRHRAVPATRRSGRSLSPSRLQAELGTPRDLVGNRSSQLERSRFHRPLYGSDSAELFNRYNRTRIKCRLPLFRLAACGQRSVF